MDQLYKDQTLAIRGGTKRSNEREHSESIFMTSSFVFDNAQSAMELFAGDIEGCTYSRFSNPTVDTFERRMALLEGGERAIATSSGMSAIFTTIMALCASGDHIVASQSLFGSTFSLMANILPKYGITTTFVALEDLTAWNEACISSTKLFFLETPSNPLNTLGDIKKISEIAHNHGALFIVDNCFATPILQKPLSLGADIVVHSATKYIDGQGRCMGGVIIGSQSVVGETVYLFGRTVGPTLSPFNAWTLLSGLATLPIRMKTSSENAYVLAKWLSKHPKIKKVYYPGLEDHPQYALAQTQMTGFGGMIGFEVECKSESVWRVIDACTLISITGNLGDVKSTITHPYSTTHLRLSPEDKERIGISEGLIRLSVGLEAVEDIQADLARGLDLL